MPNSIRYKLKDSKNKKVVLIFGRCIIISGGNTMPKLQPGDVVAVAPKTIPMGCLGNQPVIAKVEEINGGVVRITYNIYKDSVEVSASACTFVSGLRTRRLTNNHYVRN